VPLMRPKSPETPNASKSVRLARRGSTVTTPEIHTLPADGPDRNLFSRVVPPIVLPVFLSSADATVVATALPAIAATFGEVENLSWIVVASLIASTVAAPVYGRLGDTFGRRRMMLIALCIFMAASVMCSFAPSFGLLLCARVAQGLGSGGLMTLAQALLGENVPPRQRGSYQGYLSANIVAGATIGPVLGGFLTQAWGWQSVFLAYLPVGLVAVVLLSRLPPGVRGSRTARFDSLGMILLSAFVVPLLLMVSQLQRMNIASLPTLAGLAALTVAALVVLLWQQRRATAPLLALPLLRIPAFWRSTVMGACSGASLTAMMTFLPIYLQVVTGASPAQSGLLLIPLTGAVSSGSVLTGWLISHTGRTAIFPAVGLAITALTLIGLAIWAPWLSRVQLSWLLAIGGVTQGASMITAQITAQAVAGPRQLGAASAAVQLSRSLGSAFGAATAGAVLFGLLSIMDPDTASLFADMVRHGPAILDSLPPARQLLVQSEISVAFRGVFLTVACFSCTIVVCAATLPVRRL
jgi:EmrB/QacA subfamily drug resistance transporter